MFGNCLYRDFEYKMVTHARVFALVPKFDGLNKYVGLFIANYLSKMITKFSYSDMCSWNKIKDFEIKFPVKEKDIPNFEYMIEYMKSIEKLSEARVQNMK